MPPVLAASLQPVPFPFLPALPQLLLFVSLVDLERDPSLHAEELRREIRRQFEVHSSKRDQAAVRFLLSDGKLKLKQLGEMLGMQQ